MAADCRYGARLERLSVKGEVCAADAERSEAPLTLRLGVRPEGQRRTAGGSRLLIGGHAVADASKAGARLRRVLASRLPVSASLENARAAHHRAHRFAYVE